MPSFIGIDYGTVNMGVAIGQSITQTASALETIKVKHPFIWGKLDKIIEQWQPQAIIIERYSSMQANDDFLQARKQGNAKRKHSKNLDAHAAKNILQRWLDNEIFN